MPSSIERVFDHRNGPGQMDVTVPAPGRDPDELWRVLATPRLWPQWAPHIQRVTSAAATTTRTVRVGERVRIHSWGPAYVTAAVTLVDEPNRWDFRVDLPFGQSVAAAHEVLREPVAVRVAMTLRGPLPGRVGSALLAAYRPLAAYALRQLVTLASRSVT